MPEKKEKKQNLILDAAFELMLEKGYSNTKIIDIANKAGIGKGTFYEYFESKEALVLELVNTRVKEDYLKLSAKAEQAPTCRLKLADYFKLEMEATSKYKANVTDFMNEFMRSNTEISAQVLEAVHGIILLQFKYVHNVIKEGVKTGEFKNVDPTAAAACFMGSISFFMSMLHAEAISSKTAIFQHVPVTGDAGSILDCIFDGIANIK